MYMRLIDGNFTKVEKYWVGLLYSSKMIQMTSPKSEAGYYSAQEQLKSDMETVVQSYPYIEDIFVFDASHALKYGIRRAKSKKIYSGTSVRRTEPHADRQ